MAKSQATPPKNRKGSKANAFAQILNGEFLTKSFVLDNLNYIFFIMLLLLVLISKGYYGKQLTKDTDAAQRNLDQHSAEFIEAKARLELVTRRFKMAELGQGVALAVPRQPVGGAEVDGTVKAVDGGLKLLEGRQTKPVQRPHLISAVVEG